MPMKRIVPRRTWRQRRRLGYRNGDYVDALMRWAFKVRGLSGQVAGANTLAEIKAVLGQMADLPPEVDSALGHWAAVKARNPKNPV